MPRGFAVLSVEFKVNLMKPAAGEPTTIAVMQGTMMAVRDNASLVD